MNRKDIELLFKKAKQFCTSGDLGTNIGQDGTYTYWCGGTTKIDWEKFGRLAAFIFWLGENLPEENKPKRKKK